MNHIYRLVSHHRFNHKAFAAQSFSSINEMVIFALQDGS